MLSKREENILDIIVSEFIANATPISSESIAINYGLGVSPATIRNEMARLEEQGFITRPHISAGGIPSDKGYRYYVERLIKEDWLPYEDQQTIDQLFKEMEQGLEEWGHLATMLLARRLRSVAIVILPQSQECRLKRLDLVAIHEFLILLVFVLQEARLKQKLLRTEHKITQSELDVIANKLNSVYADLNCSEIEAHNIELSSVETDVTKTIRETMRAEDEQQHGEVYLDGLHHLLTQPEFSSSNNTPELIDILEKRGPIHKLISLQEDESDIKVVIGSENTEKALHKCSVVIRSYGVSGRTRGAVSVIGPTRMPYKRVISTVDYLTTVMSQSMENYMIS